MQEILDKIVEERNRQEILWKEQNHDSINSILEEDEINKYYGIPSIEEAQYVCQLSNDIGELSWADIFLEEVCEAICTKDEQHRKEELIQCAALCISWVQAIERKEKLVVNG